jgi:putative transposase
VEIVKRTVPAPGFVVQAKRWIVDQRLGWLSQERRLERDYERTEEYCEAFVYLGMIRRMLRRRT